MAERWDWVEILEPRSKECIYANLTTGECVCEPPPGVRIKRMDSSHWWELFDKRTLRLYYYNAVTHSTAWNRPDNCDIIPLAKLQSLKQNTKVEDRVTKNRSRPVEKREIATQTPSVSSVSQVRPKSRKSSGSHSMLSHSSPDNPGLQSHSSGHMAQAPSQCLSYQHNRSPDSIQPFSDGRDVFLTSITNRARHFPPHVLSRDSQKPSVEVGSNGQSMTFSEESLADDSPLESPVDPWKHSSLLRGGEDVGACATFNNSSDFFEDPSGSLYEDLIQIASFHPPPQSKTTRPFPCTNPSYKGPNQHSISYGYNPEVPNIPSTMAVDDGLSQLSRSYLCALFDRKQVFHHEESNGDTPHSSFGIGRLQQDIKDSNVSQSSFLSGQQDPLTKLSISDNNDNAAFSAVGSTSSAKYSSERYDCAKVSPHDTLFQIPDIDLNSERIISTSARTRRNSEPEYANLPIVAQPATDNGTWQPTVGNSPSFSNSLSSTAVDDGIGRSISGPSCSSKNKYDLRLGCSMIKQDSEGFVDQDSEAGSVFSSPVFEPWRSVDAGFKGNQSSGRFEASMRAIGKSKSLDVDNRQVPPMSLFSFSRYSDDGMNRNSTKNNVLHKTGIEQFALENFNEHRHGILGRTVPIGNMLTWTKDVISRPMIRTQDKLVKKEAPEVFRLIQMYMTDRKAKSPQLQVALEVAQKGWSNIELRDEIYMQLCRQTTENPREESLIRGWELMGICLSVFPPSFRFHSYLERYFCHHLNMDESKTFTFHFAGHCHRQLERTSKRGAKGSSFKLTIDFVEQTLKSIFHPSNFGGTLEDIMQIQRDKFPDRQLPWIQTTLSEEVLRLNGAETEGIFRVSGDTDDVNALRTYCDQWNVPNSCTDLHALASLLKQWYRELYEPLIPPEFYNDCIASCSDPDASVAVVERLPSINRLVFCYLIRFLQVFAASENACVSKMDANNLATVMAPNCLRCDSEDPNVILKNTHREASFLKTLILNLDTSFMDGIW